MEERDKKEESINKIPTIARRLIPATLLIAAFALYYIKSGILYDNPYYGGIYELIIAITTAAAIVTFIAAEPEKFSYFIVRAIAVALFLATFSGICFSLLFYEVLPFEDPARLREAQVFLAVSASGMMGGLMRYFSHQTVTDGDDLALWHMVHSAIIGLFVSMVLFFILRAGIINQTQIDTFNIWGVTGVSAITGFFAERVIERFSSLYNEVIGGSSKQS